MTRKRRNKYEDKHIFGDPKIMPRIGDDYQAKIPQLIRDPDDPFGDPIILPRIGDKYQAKLPQLRETLDDSDLHFLVGLPLLLTCPRTRLDLNTSDQVYQFIPGIDEENWSGAERDSFLLGLYIFEKDFGGVRRFVETKEMGAILSYYFGKFHSSSEYFRWSGCRRTKSFSRRMSFGSRQQELVSRMLPKLVVECREALLDVSALFGDRKITLVDYVVSLKAIVGIDILVEAMGLGKGRQDLPDCSSLSPSEIIEFLRGDQRLSKACSSDLFWKAVWPRLQARGWHLERPGNQGYGGKGSLVFLVPGVKKFCRNKLVKGDEYFDSMTQVLSRVAQDPGLIGGLASEIEARPLDASGSSKECLSSQMSTHPSVSADGGSRSDNNENPRPRELFDLNLPYVDSETVDEQDIPSQETEDRHHSLNVEVGADMNERRHSTRTRPPTARLLYMAAHGDDMMKRCNKRKEGSGDKDRSRHSQRIRSVVGSGSTRSMEGDETGASDE